jgi:hypothetical protein
MLAAVDRPPTLAGMVVASKLVPEDRLIARVDVSAFMLGESRYERPRQLHVLHPDGELMSIKRKHYKMIFRYTENTVHTVIQSGLKTRQFPMFYDLSGHPNEDSNVPCTDLRCG